MRASHLRRHLFQSEAQTPLRTGAPTPLPAPRFPAFALVVSETVDVALHHRIHATLSSVSDRVLFPSARVALADLRHMEGYFETSQNVGSTFFSSCRRLLPEIDAEDAHSVRVFLGHHLLRSFLYLQNEPSRGIEQLDALHLRQRQLMKTLSWENWLEGVHAFLSLYEQPQSSFRKSIQSLTLFARTMVQMRMPSPEQARASLSPTELSRRFGRRVAEIWKAFCQSHDWQSFDGLPLRAEERPLNLQPFAVESHELPSLSGNQVIALPDFVPTLLEMVPLLLAKLASDHRTQNLGLKEIEVKVSFGSGHQVSKQIFLHSGLYEWDKTAAATLEQVFESVLQGGSCTNSQTPESVAHLFATWQSSTREGGDGSEPTWLPVMTADGPALMNSHEPGVAHLLSHIEHLEIEPLRLCAKPQGLMGDQLFMDEPSRLALEDISRMRRDLLAHYGEKSDHFFPFVSFRRPCASRSLSSPLSQPASDLFSHTFQIRPPAVLRRPLPFLPQKELTRRQLSAFDDHLVFLESIGTHSCYALLFPEDDYALWLSKREPLGEGPLSGQLFSCLGFFDSLALLPEWISKAPRGSDSA